MELVSFIIVLTIFVLVLSMIQDYFADKSMWYYLLTVSTMLLLFVLSMIGIELLGDRL